MDNLELKHLAPYLPYGLKVWHIIWGSELIMNATGEGSDYLSIDDVFEYAKPILTPLSNYADINSPAINDLNTDTEIAFEIVEFANKQRGLSSLSYAAYEELVRAKVDVFGLIDAGLSVDASKVESEVKS